MHPVQVPGARRQRRGRHRLERQARRRRRDPRLRDVPRRAEDGPELVKRQRQLDLQRQLGGLSHAHGQVE